MTPFLPVLTLLFALLRTGSSLSCIECVSANSSFCEGESHKCPPRSTSCIRTMEIEEIDGKLSSRFKRACNDDEHLCNQDFVINSGKRNKQVRIITKCCYSNNCNKCKIQVPPKNETYNELHCPVCYENNSYDCKPKSYIKCRGEERECIDFAATLSVGGNSILKFSLMGCVTPQGCSLGPKILPAVKIIEAKRLSCTQAAPISHWPGHTVGN